MARATVMDRLVDAVNSQDVGAIMACFDPSATMEVLSTGYRWTGHQQLGQVVQHLLTSFQDLTWQPRNRWLDAGGATEEGVWSATVVTRTDQGEVAGSVPVELPARILVEHGEQITRLRVSTDLTGLRIALGLPVSGMAEAIDTSRYATRTSQGRMRVHVRPPATVAIPVQEAKPQRPGRRSRRAGPSATLMFLPRWVTAVIAVLITIAVGGGVVYLSARTAPPVTQTAPTPVPTSAPSPAPTSSPAPSPSPTPTATDGVTQRGRTLDLSTDVLFEKASVTLTPQAQVALNRVITLIRENRVDGTIQVIGHTDAVGSTAYNLRLSKRRAQAVVDALRGQPEASGLEFVASGRGESDPVADNTTEAGKALNRRVAILLPEP